ncbi:MAG TPA: aminopeptidase P family N-terminal domain-containing protein, partial [Mariniflexile sp.]
MNKFGIGGSTIEVELNAIKPVAHVIKPIQEAEYKSRIQKACELMKAQNAQAMYLNAGTNLLYFTGTHWHASERMVGVILLPNGDLHYIAPHFEKGTVLDFMTIEGDIHCWEEHENPYLLLNTILKENSILEGHLLIDESTPFFVYEGISKATRLRIENAHAVISECRMIKSEAEIAIIQALMDITLEVQKATARILKVGITTKEVEAFINEAHKRYGIISGSYFCIVLFGK